MRAERLGVHADAGVGDGQHQARTVLGRAATVSVPPPGIACSAFSRMLMSARAKQHAIDEHRRQVGGDVERDRDPIAERRRR